MKKINVNKLLLLLLLPFAVAGCGHDESENDDANNDTTSDVEIIEDIDADFDVKGILSNYSVTPNQEEAVVKIMDNVDYYLKINIDEILDVFLRKKKRAEKLGQAFLHGKISAKTLEYYINDQIEEYNDEHIVSDRLHNVTLEIVMDTMAINPIYNRLVVMEWMKLHLFYLGSYDGCIDRWLFGEKDNKELKIVGKRMMNAYNALFKAENLIEQMIGVENKEISRP